jgi:Asp-tRNA(Asn)/Glu-tRNA(Gln) amidotransferase A subunit family amidase
MARTVADLTALFHVLLGIGDLFPEEELPLCAGVATTWKTGHLPTDTLFEGAISVLRKAGLNLIDVQVSLPSEQDQHDELAVLLCEMHDDLSQYLGGRAHAPANLSEVVAFEEAHAEVELAHFGHEFFEQSLATGGRAAADYHAARERNLSWATTCLNDALHGVDLLLAPTYGPAWKQDLVIGEGGAKAAPTTMAPAIAGWPIACVPMGLASGLPVGLGLIGRPGSEAKLLHFAALVERHLDLTGQGQFRPTFAAPRRG